MQENDLITIETGQSQGVLMIGKGGSAERVDLSVDDEGIIHIRYPDGHPHVRVNAWKVPEPLGI